MNFFSSNIKILRKKNGLRQAEIQERLGITRTTWSNYETGVSQPSIDGLINIAKFFSVSVSDLLEKEMQMEAGYMAQGTGKRRREKASYYPRVGNLKYSNFKHQTSNSPSGSFWERTSTW